MCLQWVRYIIAAAAGGIIICFQPYLFLVFHSIIWASPYALSSAYIIATAAGGIIICFPHYRALRLILKQIVATLNGLRQSLGINNGGEKHLDQWMIQMPTLSKFLL
jgi:hypothetical protein